MTKVEFPVDTITMNKNSTFTGRDDDLRRVLEVLTGVDKEESASNGQSDAKHFVRSETGPACCVLHTLAGIGKTQIALEYIHRYRSEYDATFWLEAEDYWTLRSTYAQISDQLCLLEPKTSEDDGDQRQTLAIRKAREWLQSTERKWLLVFDNMEDINDLNPYLPLETVVHGSILITTQKATDFSTMKGFGTVPVESIGQDNAAALLFKYIQPEPADEKEKEIARELSDTVDELPLAIATIGCYINQSGSNLVYFIGKLKTSSNTWTASAVSPVNQCEKNLETVFDVAITELPDNARRMIGILAFLHPDHIPEELSVTVIGTGSLSFSRNDADLLDIIRELKRRQLIRRDVSHAEPYLTTHRTVQWNVLVHLSKDVMHRWDVFQQAFRIVRGVLPAKSPFIAPSSNTWLTFQKYGAHILSLRAHCLCPHPPIELPVNFAQVLSDMGTHMWHAGKFSEGQEAMKTAVTIMDKNELENNHPLRANAYEMLGILSSFEGVSERKHSMDLRYKALEARKLSYDSIPRSKVTIDDEIKR